MNLYVMQYVVSIAECGNLSLAAENCHVGQSALSQQVGKLEQSLGVALFVRHPRGVYLTDAGEEFVRRAREILAASNELEAEMASFAGACRGNLTLGLITSLRCIGFGSMLSSFARSYPGISLNILQGGTYPLMEQLRTRQIDAAFINRASAFPANLEFIQLGRDRYDLAVPAEHPLSTSESVALKELRGERFIFHQPWQVASELCLNACHGAGFDPHIVCRAGTPNTVLNMVQGGMGIALLPTEEFEGHTLEGIRRIHLTDEIVKEVGICRSRNSNSRLVDVIVGFAKDWCGVK